MKSATTMRAAFSTGETNAVFREQSVGDLLAEVVDRVPDRIALIIAATADSAERRWTYAELHADASRAAAALLARFSPGDRVATWAGGSAEVVLLGLAAALAGIVLVTINPANRMVECEYTLTTSRSRGLFLDRVYRSMDNEQVLNDLRGRLPDLETVVYFDEWDAFLASGSPVPFPRVDPNDPALILFTSGSSGKPKAAILRHSGIVNNAALTAHHLSVPDGQVWLNLLPMFHVGGSVTMTLGCIATAGTQVLQPQFQADAALDAISRYGAYITMAVPTMLVAMLEKPQLATTDMSSLQLIVAGGSAVAPDLIRRVKAQMGAEVMSLMGQTEASGAMFSTRPGDNADQVSLSVGAPLALSEVRIADSADGRILDIGDIGEIHIRSRTTMIGYFEMPEKTAETLHEDGWLRTGDLGLMRPDGYIQVTGRKTDMIIRGGENIYPREIEDVLVEHASVAQVAVFGVPDERWGEQVAAAVVPRAGQTINTDDLIAWLQARIARHRVPKIWRVVDALPVNTSGKVQKFLLQAEFTNG